MASIVWDLDYTWSDQDWLGRRRERNSLKSPMSIYESAFGLLDAGRPKTATAL